jgi:hypothetical protein
VGCAAVETGDFTAERGVERCAPCNGIAFPEVEAERLEAGCRWTKRCNKDGRFTVAFTPVDFGAVELWRIVRCDEDGRFAVIFTAVDFGAVAAECRERSPEGFGVVFPVVAPEYFEAGCRWTKR